MSKEIQDRFAAALWTDGERFRRYRDLGDALNRAKELMPHGQWGGWLGEHCPKLGDRQAQKYMRFAKTAPGADLDEEERLWRRASGKGKRPKARSAGQDKLSAPDMDRFVPDLLDDPAEAERLVAVLDALRGWVPGAAEYGALIASAYHLHRLHGEGVARG